MSITHWALPLTKDSDAQSQYVEQFAAVLVTNNYLRMAVAALSLTVMAGITCSSLTASSADSHKGGGSSCRQSIEEIQAVHTGKPGCLSKGEAFFAQVMDRCDQAHLLDKLPGLFTEGEEEVVGDVEGDAGHQLSLFNEVSCPSDFPVSSPDLPLGRSLREPKESGITNRYDFRDFLLPTEEPNPRPEASQETIWGRSMPRRAYGGVARSCVGAT